MRLTKLTSLGLITLVVAGLGFTPSAKAITLIPPSIEFTVKPGETIKTKVKLVNETSGALEEFSSTANFRAKDESGTPEFIEETNPEDLASWIKIERGPFTLEPGGRVEIPVEINVPANADPGGHFAGILFSTEKPVATGESGVAISTKIGTLVLVRVEGEVRESAAIASFTTGSGKTGFHRLPIDFSVRIQNSGNVHVRPNGSITIRNMLGGTTTILPVNTTQGAVLPASVRKFEAVWEKSSLTGKSNFFKEFAYEWQNFALGPYTASLTMTYGLDNSRTLTSTVRFFVFPWRVLLMTVILLVLIIWLIVMSVKRYNKMIIARAASGSKPVNTKK